MTVFAFVAVSVACRGEGAAAERGVAGGHQTHGAAAADRAPETVDVDLLDLELLDQDGRTVRFKSDVIGDRIVAMNFIFTNCTTVCPILSQIFIQTQELLGDRLGKEVVLVSVSVDPAQDTPRRLKAYADRHGARPGWVFLTGDKRTVDRVLVGLDSYSADIWEHAVKVLVGDGSHGGWTSLYGFPGPEDIVAKIDDLAKVRAGGDSEAHGH